MPVTGKTQRIRDPIHDLIVFREDDETDQIAWRLINTPQFQRLRRVHQLGFSDLVYPGATHSRLAHCLGVYHTARRVIEIIRKGTGAADPARERTVLLGALLHDIGHGPFSHAFEHAVKGRSHVEWGALIVADNTPVTQILAEVDPTLPDQIAQLLREEQPKDIYASVVSSQFDADRLDYLRRDRLMTGVEFAHLDMEWIFDCLEVGTVTLGEISDPVVEPCLYLNPKGIQVAEEYLEARFRLYMMVYMHKTTRSAEKMLERLLERLREVAREDAAVRERSRLAAFIAADSPTLGDYLALDDTVVWAELHELSQSPDPTVQTLARRLVNRELYKCFDLGAVVGERDEGNRRHRFMRGVREQQRQGKFPDLLVDDTQVTGYKWYDFESTNALEKVLVKRDRQDTEPRDIAEFSSVVKSLIERAKIYRLYLPSEAEVEQIEHLYRETAR
jgi:uncharacterized protein